MPEIVVVTGGSTGVGKTWVAAALTQRLRQHAAVAVRKPVESFSPGEPRDSELLAAASGEDPARVCPSHRRYELALAPPIAAEVLHRPSFSIDDLVTEMDLTSLDGYVVLVEGVGGPFSPLARDGDTVSLARAIGAGKIVAVVDAGLGALNASETISRAFEGEEVVTYLNRFETGNLVHESNLTWLRDRHRPVCHTIEELSRALTDPAGTLTPHGDT